MMRNVRLIHLATKMSVVIIIGIILLIQTDVHRSLFDSSIVCNPVGINGLVGFARKTRWPKGVALTDDEKYRVVRRVREARSRAKKDDQPFDLTPEFIIDLFLKQGRCCFFSKRLMTWESNLNDTVAINRIDPDGPYTKENIVLCCLIVANMRSSFSYETTLKYCNAVIDHNNTLSDSRLLQHSYEDRHLVKRQNSADSNAIIMSEKIAVTAHNNHKRKPRRKSQFSRAVSQEDRKYSAEFSLKRCTFCGRYLPLDAYSKRTDNNPGPDGLEARCKDCELNRGLERSVGIEGLLKEKVSSARTRSKKKMQDSDITDEMAFKLLQQQKSLCYYSGILMTGEPGNSDNVSIDRIDSTKPYVNGNIVLCCEAINTMKNELDYLMFLEYCRAIFENAIPLDDPRLLQRPNESIGGKRREKASERKPDLHGLTIERHGFYGFSAGFSV